MQKEEIALQLALKLLENFSYNVNEYGGNSLTEHTTALSEIASTLYNEIYTRIQLKDE